MTELRRLARILLLVFRYRLDELFLLVGSRQIPGWVRVLLFLNPLRLVPRSGIPLATRVRLAIEVLGPVFVKFGQILSTRRDLLPVELANELAKLQDRVPPFPNAEARDIVSCALARPLGEVFADFGKEPLASASIAQVYAGVLMTGEEVVVKVIRPGVHVTIEKDLRLMRMVARLLEALWREGYRFHLREMVEDYRRTILDELNLLHEAANTSTLRARFAYSDLLYVPKVHWQL